MSNLKVLKSLIKEFYPYAKKRLGFNKKANIKFVNDYQNASDPLGTTGYYDPENYTITIYVTNRHPKDLLRSISHELVHHSQNCKGLFKNNTPTEENYIQTNPVLRRLEKEAYEKGNLILRDFEAQKKAYKKEIQEMSIKDCFTKRHSNLNESLMRKFNLSEGVRLVPDPEKEDIEEAVILEPPTEDNSVKKESKKKGYIVEKGGQYYTGKGLAPWSPSIEESILYETEQEANNKAVSLGAGVFLQEGEEEEIKKGTGVEAEHEDTIKKIKSNPDIPVKSAEKGIATDHVKGEDPKYYTKLTSKKCDL